MERNKKGQFIRGHQGYGKGTGWKNEERICKCGVSFSPKKKFQESCSRHCAMLGSKRAEGHAVSEEARLKMSGTWFKKGHKSWHKGTKGLVQGHWKGKKRKDMMGSNHPQWKGGVTPKNEKIRKSAEYKVWINAVFERDDYTCQVCGQRGGTLNADHIKRFADYPELRFELANGQTLCKKCHSVKSKRELKTNWINQYGKNVQSKSEAGTK